MIIDLNADLGEGVGVDAELIPLITSANICCGAYAGDPEGIFATLELCAQAGIAVGAHPGFPDRANFGRTEHQWPESKIWAYLAMQVGGLDALAQVAGVELTHLKPHGALFHQAHRDEVVARAVVSVATLFDLPVVGLPGGKLEDEADDFVDFIVEGYADRRYKPDGTLVPRGDKNAMITDPAEAVVQVKRLVEEFGVRSVCVHGDSPGAVVFTQKLRVLLLAGGFELQDTR